MKKSFVCVALAFIMSMPVVTVAVPVVNKIPYSRTTNLPYPASYTLRFSLWATASGGTAPVWSEEKVVKVTGKTLNTLLGSAMVEPSSHLARWWCACRRRHHPPQTLRQGGPYPEYFATLNKTLRAQGIDRPVLVIDLDRLDRNIDRVARSAAIAPAKTYRIVVKSIPSPALVDYVARRAHTRALMSFHRPFLQAMATLRPDADILMGKPMPIAAVNTFYATPQGAFDPARQLQWLIYTDARLAQYLELAKAQDRKLPRQSGN